MTSTGGSYNSSGQFVGHSAARLLVEVAPHLLAPELLPGRLPAVFLLHVTEARVYGEPDTTKWYSCDVVDPHLFPKYKISTATQFDKLSDFLAFNQTWYCSDEGDDHPASFTAQANTTLLVLNTADQPRRAVYCFYRLDLATEYFAVNQL
ncbi:hypothetical protein B0T26DRAFT_749005 [Lasiosphaeria miniovina]|uniref:Uncharacterized protein n=1 Tax=Lasiosphaeria miniovina TaxID=1954250 RepID=A0AA40E9B5_9PEZI|nr:uncharacterized protein B0T26DRAFT_749005 [Lasiosphaeria miniovina]KAK0728841.1 hypothetical protein B0T26DRAFT_749005 [Lasiosphaeria miniovina]